MWSALEEKRGAAAGGVVNAYIDSKDSVRVVFELEEHAPQMAGWADRWPARVAARDSGDGRT